MTEFPDLNADLDDEDVQAAVEKLAELSVAGGPVWQPLAVRDEEGALTGLYSRRNWRGDFYDIVTVYDTYKAFGQRWEGDILTEHAAGTVIEVVDAVLRWSWLIDWRKNGEQPPENQVATTG